MREAESRFLLLAAGTIFFIQVSCIIEEWIFKQLADFHYHWFVALLELAIFSLFLRKPHRSLLIILFLAAHILLSPLLLLDLLQTNCFLLAQSGLLLEFLPFL